MPRKPSDSQDRQRELALKAYLELVESYLGERGFRLVDMAEVPELDLGHFDSGDHLNARGRAVFTRVLADALAERLTLLPASALRAQAQ